MKPHPSSVHIYTFDLFMYFQNSVCPIMLPYISVAEQRTISNPRWKLSSVTVAASCVNECWPAVQEANSV